MKRLLELTTQKDVMRLSRSVLDSISHRLKPESTEIIAGHSMSEWEKAARIEAKGRGNCEVFLIVNRELSEAWLGRGVILSRLEDHIRAFAINEIPIPPITPWPMDPNLRKLIRKSTSQKNGGLFYIVLAEGLTEVEAKAVKKNVFKEFGIRRDHPNHPDGRLINEALR